MYYDPTSPYMVTLDSILWPVAETPELTVAMEGTVLLESLARATVEDSVMVEEPHTERLDDDDSLSNGAAEGVLLSRPFLLHHTC